MNQTLPTPFDIAPPPYFPPEPGMSMWLGVLALFAILITAAYIPRSKKKPKPKIDRLPFQEAETTLQKCAASKQVRKHDLFELSRKLKAVIHAYEENDLSSLGPDELARATLQMPAPSLLAFTRQVIELDRLKFEPVFDQSRVRELLSGTEAALSDYRDYVRKTIAEERNAPSSH